jgi:hypothetical protein
LTSIGAEVTLAGVRLVAFFALAVAGVVAVVPSGDAKPIIGTAAGGPPVLFSATIVIYGDSRKPLVDLQLPTGSGKVATCCQQFSFTERIQIALRNAVYWPHRGPMVIRDLDRSRQPAFLEGAVVTYRGCTDLKCAEVDVGLPTTYRSNARNARAQRDQYLNDVFNALFDHIGGRPAGFGLPAGYPPGS